MWIQLRLTALSRSLGVKVDKGQIHLDALWAKSFASHVKMKVRRGMASLELWNKSAKVCFLIVYSKGFDMCRMHTCVNVCIHMLLHMYVYIWVIYVHITHGAYIQKYILCIYIHCYT